MRRCGDTQHPVPEHTGRKMGFASTRIVGPRWAAVTRRGGVVPPLAPLVVSLLHATDNDIIARPGLESAPTQAMRSATPLPLRCACARHAGAPSPSRPFCSRPLKETSSWNFR